MTVKNAWCRLIATPATIGRKASNAWQQLPLTTSNYGQNNVSIANRPQVIKRDCFQTILGFPEDSRAAFVLDIDGVMQLRSNLSPFSCIRHLPHNPTNYGLKALDNAPKRCLADATTAWAATQVLLRGATVLEEARRALARLYSSCCSRPLAPVVFLTNGGGSLEADRAEALTRMLGVKVTSDQVQ